MTAEEITLAAENIIAQGNGYTIPARALLAYRDTVDQKRIWREIVRIGALADEQ